MKNEIQIFSQKLPISNQHFKFRNKQITAKISNNV